MRPLSVIISLLGAGILVFIFLFSGTIMWPGSPPAMSGQLSGETPVVSPAQMTPPPSAASINLTPSPSQAQIREKTTPATSVPGEQSTTPGPSRITPAAAGPYAISIPELEHQVHNLINQQRIGKDLGALSFDPVLADIARKHSEDMAILNYFDHVNPAGQNPTARGTAAGYSCRKNYGSFSTFGIAENIFQNNLYSSVTYYSNRKTVYDWNTPEEIAQITVAGWMNSSGHRENILTATFDREGIGIAIAADDKVYITEDFC